MKERDKEDSNVFITVGKSTRTLAVGYTYSCNIVATVS